MKTLIVIILLGGILSSIHPTKSKPKFKYSIFADTAKQEIPWIKIYKDKNFSGKSATLPIGSFNASALDDLGMLNNISSMEVLGNVRVILYDDHGFSGYSKEFFEDKNEFGSCLNNKISSIRVIADSDPEANTFIFIADPQVDENNVNDEHNYFKKMKEFVKAINTLDEEIWPEHLDTVPDPTLFARGGHRIKPEFMVLGGDLVQGGDSDDCQYEAFKSFFNYKKKNDSSNPFAECTYDVEAIQLPMYMGLGNHDDGLGLAQVEQFHNNGCKTRAFRMDDQWHGGGTYAWDRKGVHFIQFQRFGGDNLKNQQRAKHDACIDETETKDNSSIVWIQDNLSRYGRNKMVLAFQHYYFYSVTGVDCTSSENRWWSQAEINQLDETLEPYHVLGFNGHQHKDKYGHTSGIIPFFQIQAANPSENGQKYSTWNYGGFVLVRAASNEVDVLYAQVDLHNEPQGDRLKWTRAYRYVIENDELTQITDIKLDYESE